MIHILISACLTGENCKWNGGNNQNETVLKFIKLMEGNAEFHKICPEQMGGLLTPRSAAEIRPENKTVINTEGRDVTAEFLLGADSALQIAKKYGCAIAILKERSPSCSPSGIYDGSFSRHLTEGMGKTAAVLSDYGIEIFGESEIHMLMERFL